MENALWESLSQNHLFVDGNKRTSFAATYTFLAINGVRITADPQTVHAFIMAKLAAQAFAFDAINAWLREHTAAY